MLPISDRMKPMMKPPVPPTNKLSIEKMSTRIEPVRTFSLSPLFIIMAPNITIIPKIKPRMPSAMIKPLNNPNPGIMLIAALPIIQIYVAIIPPSSIRIPPISDRTNAAVGFSAILSFTEVLFRLLRILNLCLAR